MFPLLLTPRFMIAAAVSIYATTPGAAQTITNGGLTGVMVTRAAKVGASTTITFLTVPANRYFILTQACYTTAAETTSGLMVSVERKEIRETRRRAGSDARQHRL